MKTKMENMKEKRRIVQNKNKEKKSFKRVGSKSENVQYISYYKSFIKNHKNNQWH